MVDVTIIGAGVAGLCAASELASRGARVRLIDRGGGPGPHGCSWWAGGMLAPECEGEQAEEPVVRLGRSAADWWEGQGIQVTRAGTLVVAPGRDRRELDRFARRTSGHEMLDGEQIEALEPDLGGRFSRALFFETEAHLDPRGALTGLVERLRDQGIEIETDEVDPSVITGITIDCRGLAARDVLADLRGVKGEMLVLRCPDVELSRPIRLLHPRLPLYIVP
ncbi:MAG TPA: FAD-dependent oxidoreductase, partial [Paracoccaceae bacterium]|nr:FAD-dependent oxidoreductase [Paracoccaceae bacterium]